MAENDGRSIRHHLQIARLAILVFLAAAVRSVAITRPFLGNFATKNVVHAMIARNWALGRCGMFYPALDCLAAGKRSLHMLEFSLSAYLTGAIWRLCGGSLELWGRLTSVVFSVASVGLMYALVQRRHGPQAALAAAAVLAFSPVSIIYGQSLMVESSLVFFTLAAFFAWDRWCEKGSGLWLALAGLTLAVLWLTKVYPLVLVLPLGGMLWQATARSTGEQSLRKASVVAAVVVLALAAVPVAAWCVHAWCLTLPESPWADHIFDSMRGSAQRYRPPDPLLWDPDFYRQVLDDLATVVLTPVGFCLFLVGLTDRQWRSYALWLAAMVILVLALPRKFYEMNYYYVATLPPLCIVAGLGWRQLQQKLRLSRWAVLMFVGVGLLFSLRYSVRAAFITPEEDWGVVAAGSAVQKLAAEEEPVVTMHGTGIALLYYCNRPGWTVPATTPNLQQVLEDCRRQGARYLVVAGPDAASPPAAVTRHPLVAAGERYRIYRLLPWEESGRENDSHVPATNKPALGQ